MEERIKELENKVIKLELMNKQLLESISYILDHVEIIEDE